MIRLYLLCCLVLVGSNIAVSVDIAATKHKRQDCDVDGTALVCFSRISNVHLFAASSNLTEYRILSNTVASIRCTEPCFTAFQNLYECQGDTDQLALLNNYQCLQYEGTYCEPLVNVGLEEGTIISSGDEACGDYTFDVCPDECATITRNEIASLGCCGREIVRGGYFLSTETAELCGIDVDSFCSGSARLTASIFGAVTMVTMLAIGLLQ